MDAWCASLALVGGLAAGVLSLAVGGLGELWRIRRSMAVLADVVDDLDGRVTREVKRRAVGVRDHNAELLEQLAQGHVASGATIVEGGATTPQTRTEILKAGRARGLVR